MEEDKSYRFYVDEAGRFPKPVAMTLFNRDDDYFIRIESYDGGVITIPAMYTFFLDDGLTKLYDEYVNRHVIKKETK